MRAAIEEYLFNLKQQRLKRLESKELETYIISFIGSDAYWRFGGYNVFAKVISDLVKDRVIRPIKATGHNGRSPGLYNRYQLTIVDELSESDRQKLLVRYHPEINTSYYLKKPREYEVDETYLVALDKFLRECAGYKKQPQVTVNERSFEVFGYEKWLLSVHGQKFMQRIKITLDDLWCYQTYEPFFFFALKAADGSEKLNVLIVENKDTFFSLKKLLQDGICTWNGITFHLLIYGEGRKIQKSFSFFWELEQYRHCETTFYYFGDLDPEGILIWFDLQKDIDVEVKPFTYFYEALFEKFASTAPKLHSGQTLSKEAVAAFLDGFRLQNVTNIRRMLEQRCYLPQEGLNYILLRQLADEN